MVAIELEHKIYRFIKGRLEKGGLNMNKNGNQIKTSKPSAYTILDPQGYQFHISLFNLYKVIHSKDSSIETIEFLLSEMETCTFLNSAERKEEGEELILFEVSLLFSPGFLEEIFLFLLENGMKVQFLFERISLLDKQNLIFELLDHSSPSKNPYSAILKKKKEILFSNIVKMYMLISSIPDVMDRVKILNQFSKFLNFHQLKGSSEIAIEDILIEVHAKDSITLPFEETSQLFQNIYYSSCKDREFYLQSFLNELDPRKDESQRLELLKNLENERFNIPLSQSMFEFYLLRLRFHSSASYKILSLTSLVILNRSILSFQEFSHLLEEILYYLPESEFEMIDHNLIKQIGRAVLLYEDTEIQEMVFPILEEFFQQHLDSEIKIKSFIQLDQFYNEMNSKKREQDCLHLALLELESFPDFSLKCYFLRTISLAYRFRKGDFHFPLELYEALEKAEMDVKLDTGLIGIQEFFDLSEAFYFLNHTKKTLELFEWALQKSFHKESFKVEFLEELSENYSFLKSNDWNLEGDLIEIFKKNLLRMESPIDRLDYLNQMIELKLGNKNISDNLEIVYTLLDLRENGIEVESYPFDYLPFADKLRRMGLIEPALEFYDEILQGYRPTDSI
jgi:hypothetical protein